MSEATTWHLRTLSPAELDTLYKERIEKDFPSAERPNLKAMHRHLAEGLQEILIMTDGKRDTAYAVVACANGIALVTLLAVFKEARGGGQGTALLSLLAAHYKGQRAIVLEVEAPEDAADEADLAVRQRRIHFYEKNGYVFLPGIRHDSFGIHLLLMAHPLIDTADEVQKTATEDVQSIYHKILPPTLWERVTTKKA